MRGRRDSGGNERANEHVSGKHECRYARQRIP